MRDLAAEELSPNYVRERRIELALAPLETPMALRPLLVTVSYARTLPEGVVLPLIFEVQGPSPQSYQRREFLRTAPRSIIFTPREGGEHLVSLREAYHNKWWGSLTVQVAGELLVDPRAT